MYIINMKNLTGKIYDLIIKNKNLIPFLRFVFLRKRRERLISRGAYVVKHVTSYFIGSKTQQFGVKNIVVYKMF